MTISHLRFGPQPDPLHLPGHARATSSPATSSVPRAHRRARARRSPGAVVPAQQPVRPGRGLGSVCRATCRSRSFEKKAAVLRDRWLQGRARDRHGQPHQHHHADLLLRDLAACCRARRPSPESRMRSRRPTGERATSSSSELRRRGRRAREPSRSRASRDGHEHARACPAVPADAPAFVKRRHCGDDRRARRRPAGQRVAGRWHVSHPGPHSGRNATSRTSSRSGDRTSASSAATAPWSARTR